MSKKLLKQLPSLELLRGFVAVGRRMSITQAAQDLFLTQSAVSKQIRSLEDALDTVLLVRGHRSIQFTAAGERLFQSADSALRQMQDTLDFIAGQRQRSTLTITASIGITALWILPRLLGFQQRCPEVDVRVAADNRLHAPNAPGIDLAIRYCAERDAPPGAVRLFGETLVLVAHPSRQGERLDTPEKLAGEVLLELDLPHRPWLHWHGWFAARGFGESTARRMLRYNQYDQVVQAAMAGQGIAIGRLELIAPMLADGRLVTVSEADTRLCPYSYWLLRFGEVAARNDDPREAAIAQFTQWILEEARLCERG